MAQWGRAFGTAAILLAKWAGAWVATTVSREEQAEVARAAGADLVLNRHEEDAAQGIRSATGGHGVDRIVDVYTTPEAAMREAAEEVSAYAASGAHAPRIAKAYAPEVAETQESQESGKAIGNVLVRIQNP
ncbi:MULTISPECIES: zinc-binding dehydrogenase [Rhizobium]|uniref:Threonine dehydrogenase-like Zn-dependent dehydrogenase n=1 Tax=Rhizobium tropici TaxID=398 RepID=A0ABR6R6J8_RHITR|nr:MULTISPECIES: zinc-binding dehydrogenase [Rhizobium]MBB4244478.1 threonine dehydrogenase-like Zn-dependent dehydrogenase [Rhizobium tropici]MBB5595680.1 threonine dehydrogenase-like Zn-dependent dehydrogenase [Rhizobium tropici]MBB6494817.1 threonine dehydrogenase-like Zn-dependent dehydrogenase [Rhizobium tropici]